MRARAGLAAALWRVGQWEEAIWRLQELLKLNPADNQGIHFTLLTWLVFMGESEPVEALLQAFPDEESAAWLYSSALWLFRKDGASFEARQRLRQAWASSRHVPGYLLPE